MCSKEYIAIVQIWYPSLYMSANCLLECSDALGMESGAIADRQITASSQYNNNYGAAKGRLNNKGRPGSWSASRSDRNPWFQIDLENNMMKITRVATQGRYDLPQWVTRYKLQFSKDGKRFMTYKRQGTTADTVRKSLTLRNYWILRCPMSHK